MVNTEKENFQKSFMNFYCREKVEIKIIFCKINLYETKLQECFLVMLGNVPQRTKWEPSEKMKLQ